MVHGLGLYHEIAFRALSYCFIMLVLFHSALIGDSVHETTLSKIGTGVTYIYMSRRTRCSLITFSFEHRLMNTNYPVDRGHLG
jgi:hypothetical protein